MKKIRQIGALAMSMLLAAGILCSCSQPSGEPGKTEGSVSGTLAAEVIPDKTVDEILEETVSEPDLSAALSVELSDSTGETGGGWSMEDGVLTVTAGGTYVLSGVLSDGRIIVNAPKEEVVLVMNNVEISCSYGSPLYVYKSSCTTVYLTEETENIITDGHSYTFADAYSSSADGEPNACLYSKSDLILAGAGSLTVYANYNNGITGKDTLRIEEATVTVEAVNHGINGKDSCVIKDAKLRVTCGGDAIRSTNDTDSELGFIIVSDSAMELTSGEDGMQAQTYLVISDGSGTVCSGGGSEKILPTGVSAKGLKAGSVIRLLGGTYVLNCCDDAVHSNGSVEISGGSYTICTGDDGIHADETVQITGGDINVSDSYEGIEGTTVDISGGNIRIVASDDGINGAGGADQSGFGGRPGFPGGDTFGGSSGNASVVISGGVVVVNASGDGLDSNGSLTVSGGEVYVNGPTTSGNGALDYDGTGTVTGGTVVAVGSSGMSQNFGSASTQGSILLSYSAYSTDTVTVTDADGNLLVSYTPEKRYNCVVISTPALVLGGTYTVSAGGESRTVTLSSLIYGSSSGTSGRPGRPF